MGLSFVLQEDKRMEIGIRHLVDLAALNVLGKEGVPNIRKTFRYNSKIVQKQLGFVRADSRQPNPFALAFAAAFDALWIIWANGQGRADARGGAAFLHWRK